MAAIITTLLDAVTATGAGSSVQPVLPQRTFSCVVAGTGAVTATVLVQVTNDATNGPWMTAATFTLSGTTSASDGVALEAPWAYVRGNVSAITGTGAAVTLKMAV